MNCRVTVETFSSCTVVHSALEGVLTESLRASVAQETLTLARENQITKVIWDIREATLDYSLIRSHAFALDIKSVGVTPSDSVAVVYRNNPEQHEHSSLVLANRGITNVRYFTDIEEAVDWLSRQ